ncbi:MAG: rane transport protein [Candidatus Saccharibacteria bacterium]|nr:rane transport protein [Candidatus Saccharibacteria bacterium]
MGQFLHLLARTAYKHPWRVLAVWLLILATLITTTAFFFKAPGSSISIPGTPAQQAIDHVGDLFPAAGGGTGRIVFKAENGETIVSQREKIESLLAEVAKEDGVSQVVSPFLSSTFISESGDIAYAQVQLSGTVGSIDEGSIASITNKAEAANSETLQVEIAGDLINKTPGEIVGVGEIAGVAIALVVLLITLGSLIAAGMPLLTALIGIGVSMTALFSLSQVIEIGATTPVLAIMLGLAVGIDYALFITNKYRSLLLLGYSYEEALKRALGTAGNAVVFAAITVIIALSALTVVNIPFMTTMGLSGAGSIAIAALVAISALPALLRIAGPKIFSRKQRLLVEKVQKHGAEKIEHVAHNTLWYKWSEQIIKRPIIFLLVGLLIVIPIALPAQDLKLGLPTDQYAATESTERKAYDLLTEGFGVGFNAPLTVLVQGLPKVTEADKVAARQFIMQQSAGQPVPTTPAAQQAAFAQLNALTEQYAPQVQLMKVATEVGKLNDVQQALAATATKDGTAGIIQVIPKTAPIDAKTNDLIERLRDTATAENVSGNKNVTFEVTGSTALQKDINEKLSNALPVYLIVVVGLSIILLIIAFRSILVPLKATLGFLLSVLAMFGALVAVFQWGWFGIAEAPGPIVSFIPIIATGVLFGLAMDYEFFLVSGMHEEYTKTKDAKRSVARGFRLGAKVVTAAAIIMISVFAGFIFNHDATIQAIGFALAVGILVDAFIVRMTIVPAVMTLLGKSAWWIPKWLDKRLPHVSIEGEEDDK